VLLIATNQTLLHILSDGTPVVDTGFSDVVARRLNYYAEVTQTPILGRVILFSFWLAIGSFVYMLVWLFQNIAVEVYDDVSRAKLRSSGAAPVEEESEDSEEDNGWWGTTLSHTIFVGSSVMVLLFFVVIVVNFLFPAAVQLFEIGLQTFTELSGITKLLTAIASVMVILYVFVLFWKLFFRLRSYIYHSF